MSRLSFKAFCIELYADHKSIPSADDIEFMQNLSEMRLTSLQNGNVNMSLDEINAEIAAVRKNGSHV